MLSGTEIFFELPQVGFFILLLIPFLIAEFFLTRYRQKQQLAYASPHLLPYLLVPRSLKLKLSKVAGWTLIWILTCLALMEPFGNIRYPSFAVHSIATSSIPHEVIFLVDTSASMGVADSSDGKTRLETAKEIMEDVLRQLKGQTVSLYAFTSELSALVPPTLDYLFTRLVIHDLHLDEGDVGGTRFAPVLESLKEQAFPAPSLKRYTVIMLTDGGDTQLETLTGASQKQAREAILNAISDPQQLHLRLLAVGVGSSKPQTIPHVTFEGKSVLSKLESEILQQLALHGRGKYYDAEEWNSWNLAQELMVCIHESEKLNAGALGERKVVPVKKEERIVDLYYQIPLGLALLFYFINLLLPDVHRVKAY